MRAAPKPGPPLHRSSTTAKLHDIDPRHYLTDVLERIVSGRTKINQLHMLLPWNWKAERDSSQAKLAA
ncbi:transposase domain-containing protein [Bradyrhizobium lupini]